MSSFFPALNIAPNRNEQLGLEKKKKKKEN